MSSRLEDKINLSGIPGAGKIIIGFSGGADSMALAHYMCQSVDKSRIICLHINHMLRGDEANRDESVASSFCEKHKMSFDVLRVNVKKLAKERKMGIEECGREVRYEYFSSLVKNDNDVILTAHNADDNAETIIMNLVKGTGITGMKGIPYKRQNIVRPLINVTRKEIEAYCEENQLDYVVDSTNLEDDYDRNKIRSKVMPVLNELNPSFVENIYRETELFRLQDEFIKRESIKLIEQAETDYGLDVSVLNHADKILVSTALKLYFEEHGCKRLSKENIDLVIKNLENGGRIHIPGKLLAECSRGILTVTAVDKREHEEKKIESEETVLKNGKTLHITIEKAEENLVNAENSRKVNNLLFNYAFDYDTINGDLLVRGRKSGDKFRPAGRNVTKKLKQLLAENDIPAAKRSELVIIEDKSKDNAEIIFIEGIGVSERYKVTKSTKNIAIIKIEDTVSE